MSYEPSVWPKPAPEVAEVVREIGECKLDVHPFDQGGVRYTGNTRVPTELLNRIEKALLALSAQVKMLQDYAGVAETAVADLHKERKERYTQLAESQAEVARLRGFADIVVADADDLQRYMSHLARLRDNERHPEIAEALVRVRTSVADYRAAYPADRKDGAAQPEHICGLAGYNGMIDPPCPACQRWTP